MEIVGTSFKRWAEQISTPDRPVTMDFVEVSFQAVQDEAKRQYLSNTGTNFDLEDEQVDRLISAAREVLRVSPELKNFLDFNLGSNEKNKAADGISPCERGHPIMLRSVRNHKKYKPCKPR